VYEAQRLSEPPVTASVRDVVLLFTLPNSCPPTFLLPACLPACLPAVQALLAQKAAITNWAEFSKKNNITGWNESVPVCNWTRVTCTEQGSINSV